MVIRMSSNSTRLAPEKDYLVRVLEQAFDNLNGSGRELVLDFSPVLRVDPEALATMERLACLADSKGARITLQGAGVVVYKVLKLAKLAPRFAFTASQS